jgi:hypothetical protein
MVTAAAGEEPRPSSRVWLCLATVLLAYCFLRIFLLPADGAVSGGITHDSAYLAIVAGQVRSGHGFVNPAHWLLELKPEKLPMPYHNANPGYPAAMAVLASLTGRDVIRAGFALSALSNALLALAVFVLVFDYARRWQLAACASAAVAFFPASWIDSLSLLPDAVCTALTVSAVAIVVTRRNAAGALLTGLVLGAAWEARSSASLALVPIGWWLFRTRPRSERAASILLFLAGFVLMMSPWLIHTQRVWGSPFRSDAEIYLLECYLARPFGGDLDRLWRSLDIPRGLGAILLHEPFQFIAFYLKGLPRFAYFVLAFLAGFNKVLAACYVFLTAAAGWVLRSRLRSPEFQAGALLSLLTLAATAVRADGVELRYLGVVVVLWVLFIVAALDALTDWRGLRRAMAFAAVLALILIPREDFSEFRLRTAVDPQLAAKRDAYRQIAAQLPPDARVLVWEPYFYTLYTGRTAISPPYADKPQVMAFVAKYSARYMALPTKRLDYYYADIRRQFAPQLRELNSVGPYTLFEVQP